MIVSQARNVEEAISEALWQIGPLPGAVGMLMSAVDDESVDAEEVARAVSLDEMLTSQVMRAANSAALGFRSPVQTIAQAIARLGCRSVRSMALAEGAAQILPLPREVGGVSRLSFWEHNWATATAATELAPRYGVNGGEAHLAGLLHDVGKLVLAFCIPVRYESCVEKGASSGAILCLAERQLLGRDHASVGGEALRAWDLPQTAVLAAAQHHEPPRLTSLSPITQLVQAANCIAHASNIGRSGNTVPIPIHDCCAGKAKLTKDVVRKCLLSLQAQRSTIEELAAQLAHGPSPDQC